MTDRRIILTNELPISYVDDSGEEYPLVSIHNRGKPECNGIYIADLINEDEPVVEGNIMGYRQLNSWSPKQIKDKKKKDHDSYSKEDLKILEKEFNGRTVKGSYCGNGYLVPVSGDLEFFEESNEKNNLIFSNYGTLRILIYKNEKLNEYLLPLNKEGDNTDCLIISSEEFDKIIKKIKKMKNGTTII